MFPYYLSYTGKEEYDCYAKFFREDFDDRWAYYRFKAEQYPQLFQQCGIISHDINKEQDYCIYKPKEIVEDWVMVLGLDIKKIDFHALDGKIILYVSKKINNLPQDKWNKKITIFKELGFLFPPNTICADGTTFNWGFNLACNRIITNFDITTVRDIFNSLGIKLSDNNWAFANRKYLATSYNSFIFRGWNNTQRDEDIITEAFGSIKVAEEIRKQFWKKRYPDDEELKNEYELYKSIWNNIRSILESAKDNHLCGVSDESIHDCFVSLMIFRDRYFYCSYSNAEPKYLCEQKKIEFLIDLMDTLSSDDVKITSKGKENIKLGKKDVEHTFLKSIVAGEVTKILPNIYYNDAGDLLETYIKNDCRLLFVREWAARGIFVPTKEKFMEGFIYDQLINSIDWEDKAGEQAKSYVVYQLGQLVKMQTREDNQKNIHRYYKDEREKYQQAIIEDWGLNNHSRS